MSRSTRRRSISTLARAFATLALVIASFTARADDQQHHTLWMAKGKQNAVYLLGSVHALKLSDSDLPAEAMRAYSSAKTLVMELDLGALGPDQLLNSVVDRGTLPPGQKLRDVLGTDLYEKFSARANVLGLDPGFMSHFQPWFAAMVLQQVELANRGFAPYSGVDMQLAMRARADKKKIIGLETIDEQFGIFAQMSLEEQRRFVLYSLYESDDVSRNLESLVAAWKAGDTKKLEELAGSSLRRSPGWTAC